DLELVAAVGDGELHRALPAEARQLGGQGQQGVDQALPELGVLGIAVGAGGVEMLLGVGALLRGLELREERFKVEAGLKAGAAAATATAATAAAAVATAAATTAAIFAGLGLVDGKITAVVLLAVEGRDRGLGLLIGAHLDETETLAAAGVPVADHLSALHRAV